METTHKEGVKMASDDVNGSTVDALDPWNPPYPPCRPMPPDVDFKTYSKLICEWFDEVDEIIASSRRTKIIIPDRTPQSVDDAFYKVLPHLWPILEKDSVRRFLTLFDRVVFGMACGFIVTPLTFNEMVKRNALKCTAVALEGKAPELYGYRANPNCMNRYGFFPLHQAAEIFSVDMVKLLLSYGALANLRTAGPEIIEGLLPLHVAVENTCLHKYLEGNAHPNKEDLNGYQANVNYICKLIHLLCLPEMKIFLDTTRLLAEKTDNIIDELCNYIKAGRLVETAVLLLAAQEQIRGVSSGKKKGSTKPDGFPIIKDYILNHTVSLVKEMGQSEKANKKLKVDKKLTDVALLLVHAVSQAGVALDACIRSHPEAPHNMQVPHDEVHEKVSSILNNHGFCPTGRGIDIGNLCPYKNVLTKKESPNKSGDMYAIKGGCQHSEAEKVVRNKTPRGWELKYARRSFFPYWRSVLVSKLPLKLIRSEDICAIEEQQNSWNKLVGKGSPLYPPFTWRHYLNQPKRTFCSSALPLLKAFRNA